MVEGQEHEGPQVELAALRRVVDGAEHQVDGTDGEQIVEVSEERIFEFAVFLERLGHLGPVLGEVFPKMPVGIKFAALETESLVVADSEQCRDGEQRERREERRGLVVLLVEDLREREDDEREDAEDGLLAGLREEGEAEREENPVVDGVAVVSPLEYEKRERGEENVERFHRHGSELE